MRSTSAIIRLPVSTINWEKSLRRLILIATLTLLAGPVLAWDCSLPQNQQSTNPKGECYVAPKTTTPLPGQSQTQGQTQNANAQATGGVGQGGRGGAGGSVSVAPITVTTGPTSATATGGTSTSTSRSGAAAEASNAGNQQVSNTSTYVAPGPANLGLPTQIIAGCGVAMSAGGSNVHGAAMLGFGFTTAECYAYIEAQAYWAIGDRYDACEVLHTTNAAKRSSDRGAHFLACAVPEPEIRYIEVNRGPTEAEIELRIQHAIAEYINEHPDTPCPKPRPRHGKVKPSPGCRITIEPSPVTVVPSSKLDVDVNVRPDLLKNPPH